MLPVPATPRAYPKLLGPIFNLAKCLSGAGRFACSRLCLLGVFFSIVSTAPAAAMNLADLVARTAEARPSFFGSQERELASPDKLPQWSRVLRHAPDIESVLSACLADKSDCTTPTLRRWHAAVSVARGLPRAEQLAAVNDFFNRWPYRSDTETYGAREYWATPLEFMIRSGDCEDYAIAKFFTLRVLGFTNDALRIVALRDRIRRIGHAVVTVRLDDQVLVLDSLSNLILPQKRYRHYVARFSVNEISRWQHFGSFKQKESDALRQLSQGES